MAMPIPAGANSEAASLVSVIQGASGRAAFTSLGDVCGNDDADPGEQREVKDSQRVGDAPDSLPVILQWTGQEDKNLNKQEPDFPVPAFPPSVHAPL